MIHGLNGGLIIPVLGLVLLIVAFLTRDKMLVRWGAITFALVIIQSQLLAPLGREYPSLGALHGANALLLLAAAVVARHRARTQAPASEPAMAT